MNKNSKIFIAGSSGMVGSAICRKLKSLGYNNIITTKSSDLDLRIQSDVEFFFRNNQIEYVFLAAAKVGGILANNRFKGQFIYDNLMIQTNTINSAYQNGVKKLLFLGSSCIYPKFSKPPIKEEYVLSSELEQLISHTQCKYQVLNCVKATDLNMDVILFLQCQLIFMGLMTIMI